MFVFFCCLFCLLFTCAPLSIDPFLFMDGLPHFHWIPVNHTPNTSQRRPIFWLTELVLLVLIPSFDLPSDRVSRAPVQRGHARCPGARGSIDWPIAMRSIAFDHTNLHLIAIHRPIGRHDDG